MPDNWFFEQSWQAWNAEQDVRSADAQRQTHPSPAGAVWRETRDKSLIDLSWLDRL